MLNRTDMQRCWWGYYGENRGWDIFALWNSIAMAWEFDAQRTIYAVDFAVFEWCVARCAIRSNGNFV